jgi:hypothetical protein
MRLWTQIVRARFRLQITKKSNNPTLQFDQPETNPDEPSAGASCDYLNSHQLWSASLRRSIHEISTGPRSPTPYGDGSEVTCSSIRRRAVVRRKEHRLMLSPLRLACSNNCRRTSKSLDTITLHCRRIRKPTIELSLSPEEYHDLLSPKCPSKVSKKPLIFVLLLILSAHLIQKGLNRRKTRENVATSTMVFGRIRTETVVMAS